MVKISTKDKLINATMELVNSFGFHNTPTSKIAKKANFSEATIYKHFSNKDALLIEVYLKIKSDLNIKIFEGTETIIDLREKSKIIFLNYLEYFLENENQLNYYLQFTNSSYMNQIVHERGKIELKNLIQYISENTSNGFFKNRPIPFYHAFVHAPILEIARSAIAGELELTKELKEEVISNVLSLVVTIER